ncbi:MAG: PIN domain-containing protein [Burkholderiales bacterium]|jgi:predicted nucleic acid-binding protein|nr:PIN domain-containing protein [Burkholderiales bacterium]
MRLFLDANILFSAVHNPDGNARALFSLARSGLVKLHVSGFARDEAGRNVALKFPQCREALEDLLEAVWLVPEPQPQFVQAAKLAGLQEKDEPILAAATVARVDALVTGERRHFGALFGQRVGDLILLSPADASQHSLEHLPPSR